MKKRIKINLWIFIIILSSIFIMSNLFTGFLTEVYSAMYTILFFIGLGFEELEKHLGYETNIIDIKWSKE